MKKIAIMILLIIIALYDSGADPEHTLPPVTAQKPAVSAFADIPDEVPTEESIPAETPQIETSTAT